MRQGRANTIGRIGISTALGMSALLCLPAVRAQDPMQYPPPVAAPEQQTQAAPPAETPSTQSPPPAKPAAKPKGKQPYTGPTNVIEQAPTPMLDGEGRQRLDPDGKPMFNPPVKQQRDKYGHPLFDDKGQPVFQTATDLGFDEHGKKMHTKKEKPPKTISVSISKGTLTVDGMIGKAALNYDISDLKFMYLYAPWVGTVVVSNVMFPGAKEQQNGFNQNTLTVNVEDHTFQLYSEKMMLGQEARTGVRAGGSRLQAAIAAAGVRLRRNAEGSVYVAGREEECGVEGVCEAAAGTGEPASDAAAAALRSGADACQLACGAAWRGGSPAAVRADREWTSGGCAGAGSGARCGSGGAGGRCSCTWHESPARCDTSGASRSVANYRARDRWESSCDSAGD